MNLNNSFEEISCNLCGEKSTRMLFSGNDWFLQIPGKFKVVECNSCGLKYINPRPKRDMLYEHYYPKEYYTHKNNAAQRPVSSDKATLTNTIKKVAKKVLLHKFSPKKSSDSGYLYKISGFFLLLLFRNLIITKSRWGLIGKSGRLLDVGCGNGGFLHGIKNDWLFDNKIVVTGIDIDPEAIKNAKNLGLEAKVSDAENIPFTDNHFDIITVRHSLEHVPDPMKTLNEAYRLMKPGGILIAEVPNSNSIGTVILKDRWAGFDAPRHLFHFSPETLKKIVEKAGFQVMELHKWQGTFRKDISLQNMNNFWDSKGIGKLSKRLRYVLYSFLFSVIDKVYKGGTISVKAVKPS